MNINILAICLAGALLLPSAFAGIPVMVDADPLRQAHYLTDAQNWLKTVEQYKAQLTAYKAQLATATGVRNVQDFLSEAKGLSNDLKNLQKNGISLNDLLANPNGSYNSALNGLYSKYTVFDTCYAAATEAVANTCKQMVINKAAAMEDTTAVQNNINRTVSDISALVSRVELSRDAKESQDLANTITSKSVQLNALTTQWEMSVKQSELRDSLLKDKQQKAFRERQSKGAIPTFN
jgi:type IV secretion system protein VirB5